jgi:hypothetical protein
MFQTNPSAHVCVVLVDQAQGKRTSNSFITESLRSKGGADPRKAAWGGRVELGFMFTSFVALTDHLPLATDHCLLVYTTIINVIKILDFKFAQRGTQEMKSSQPGSLFELTGLTINH